MMRRVSPKAMPPASCGDMHAANKDSLAMQSLKCRPRLLLAAAAALSLAAVSHTALAQDSAKDSVKSFYAGKTVNLYVGFSPGGSYDFYARLFARHIGKHIPGNPNVVVHTMTGAGRVSAGPRSQGRGNAEAGDRAHGRRAAREVATERAMRRSRKGRCSLNAASIFTRAWRARRPRCGRGPLPPASGARP
jgi:hypothetical protein